MEEELIQLALSYDLGSDLHEVWRESRKQSDGTYEPKIKKSKDEEWNAVHGTDQVDIANCSFLELPSNWQYEKLESAKVVIHLVYDKTMNGESISGEEAEKMASIIHEEWLKRNDWVYDSEYGNPSLTVSYSELSREEQISYLEQLGPAVRKVQDYKDGFIDIDAICERYGLSLEQKVM